MLGGGGIKSNAAENGPTGIPENGPTGIPGNGGIIPVGGFVRPLPNSKAPEKHNKCYH